MTAEAFEPLRKITSLKPNGHEIECTQIYLTKQKKLITKDACMQVYDDSKPLYLETNASGIGLGAGLLREYELWV